MPIARPSSADLEAIARRVSRESPSAVRFERIAHYEDRLYAARFRWDNGLRVVVMPDYRAPVFAYQTWFRVGSRDEDPERTGLAHLFEHLMFKGTTNHAAGELDREMERRGSQTNAATWVDWTYYTEALAARDDNLEVTIAFEADRMVNVVVDDETFASELEVVKNERRMSVDDSVVGSMGEALFELAYREHPYRWPTIGSMAHLEHATLDELRGFYRSYYAPNNAVVVVVGAVDVADVLTRIGRHYGPLASQPVVARSRIVEPRQRETRERVLRLPIVTPQILIGFRAPAQLDDDFPAAEILSDILVSGDSARLCRTLITEKQLATEVQGYVSPFAEPGLYELLITVRTGVDPRHVLDATQAELDRLTGGASERELTKARNSLELSTLAEFRDAEGSAEALGHHEANYDDFGLAFSALERFHRVSPDDLRRVAAELFRVDNRNTILAVPDDEGSP